MDDTVITCVRCRQRTATHSPDLPDGMVDLMCDLCSRIFLRARERFAQVAVQRRARAGQLPRMTWPEFCRWLRMHGLRAKHDYTWCAEAYVLWGCRLSIANSPDDLPGFEHALIIHQLDLYFAAAQEQGIDADQATELLYECDGDTLCPACPQDVHDWSSALALPADDFMPDTL